MFNDNLSYAFNYRALPLRIFFIAVTKCLGLKSSRISFVCMKSTEVGRTKANEHEERLYGTLTSR